MRKITQLVFLMLLIAQAAFAVSAREPGCNNAVDCNVTYNAEVHKYMLHEWYACKDSSECGVASGSCSPSVGVNKRFMKQAQALICKSEDCSGSCDASAIQATSANCVKGVCMPDMDSRMKELFSK